MRPDIMWQIVSTGSLVALLLLSIWLSKRFTKPLPPLPPPFVWAHAKTLLPTTPGSLEQIGGGWDEIFRDHRKCRENRRDNRLDDVCEDCRPVQLWEAR